MVEPEGPAASPAAVQQEIEPAARNLRSAIGKLGFPIVGIGCSAGGLEALERFFAIKPNALGMAIVIVQHLSPTQPSALPGLLHRITGLVVTEVVDGEVVEAGHVYVIAPNKDLSIVNGTLRLVEATSHGGLRLSVDLFLRALAADQGEAAIAVILSGMGSDGLLGADAIRGKGGLVLAQDPASAGADSMPRAIIAAGLAHIVTPPERMLAGISEYLGHPTIAGAGAAPEQSSDFHTILALMRDRWAVDFSLYKANTLMRRIDRRVAVHRLAGLRSYAQYLRENPQELDLLFRELLIGVTSFFRDPNVWEVIRDEAIPALLSMASAGQRLRAWTPACSSGEEAYSLAIVFLEAMEKASSGPRADLQIYATDLDPDAIEIARKGVYPRNVMVDVSPERIARYFVEEPAGFRIRKEVREMVVFATQNIIADPPFTKLDFVSCRNLMIYFQSELQKKLMPVFHYALRRGGMLLLGSAESVGPAERLFAPFNAKARLFRRLDHSASSSALDFMPNFVGGAGLPAEIVRIAHAESLEVLADKFIQQTYAPPAVLVNGDGDILYVSGRTGKYLEPSAGRFNVNIHAMLRDGLREALPGAIRKAVKEAGTVRLDRLEVVSEPGAQIVNVTIQPLDKPDALRGNVLIVFHDVTTPPKPRRMRKSAQSDIHEALLRELQQAREAQQVTYEEMQASMEELRSNNEELQSTNEELTTSKEEMRSLNEEMQTVNAELQSKVDDLTSVKNDMANLLNSTEIATIFLDVKMRLRRYTPHAVGLFKLIPGDVGRPLSDVSNDLDYPELRSDAERVLRTLVFQERQVGAHDGSWYRVRIMPYRTQDNVIDGVVMTFIDISEVKRLQDKLSHFNT